MNNPKYYQRFDIVSMLLSFFVVMIHSSYTAFYSSADNLSNNFSLLWTKSIPGFAVPMFFILSGMKFYHNFSMDKCTSKIMRRKNSLLIPYLSWNLISTLWALLICSVPFISKYIKARTVFDSSIIGLAKGLFWFNYIHPLWFLAVLMIFVLLTPLFYFLIKNKTIGVVSMFFLYLLHALPINYPETHYPIFQIRTLIYSADFYLIGAFLGRFYYTELCQNISRKAVWTALISFVIIVIFRYFTEDINCLFIPLILIGVYCIWVMTGRLQFKEADWIHMSFFIYPAHTFILPCINKLIYLLSPDTSWAAIINTVSGTVISYCLCIVIGLFLKRNVKPIWIIINGR